MEVICLVVKKTCRLQSWGHVVSKPGSTTYQLGDLWTSLFSHLSTWARLLQKSNEINYVNHLSQCLHRGTLKVHQVILLWQLWFSLCVPRRSWLSSWWAELTKGWRGLLEDYVPPPASTLSSSWGFLDLRSPRVSVVEPSLEDMTVSHTSRRGVLQLRRLECRPSGCHPEMEDNSDRPTVQF